LLEELVEIAFDLLSLAGLDAIEVKFASFLADE
jgi:hypothetical protein